MSININSGSLIQIAAQFWKSSGFVWRLTRIIVLSSVAVVVLIMTFEDKLIFFPAKYPEGFWEVQESCRRLGEVFPLVEDCRFSTSDGVSLHGWYCKPVRCGADGPVPVTSEMVVLWFHGNAGNITHRYDMIREMLMKLPVDVFIIDYRGYGKSGGTPSERGLYLDARAAWSYLTDARHIEPNRIVILGKSLGGVPAVDLASKVPAAGLIVQSSFTSAADMANRVLPFYPKIFSRTTMDSASKIGQVGVPKLFIHSQADEVVPYELGKRLYEAAHEPKEFYEVAGAHHNSTYIVGGEPYFETLRRFILSCHER
jgi:uncharacterized protein